MARASMDNVKEYYRLITEIDIGLVARELLGARIIQKNACLLQSDCPNHKSNSHRSQSWYCFGWGVCGDVPQLVKFIPLRRGDPWPVSQLRQLRA